MNNKLKNTLLAATFLLFTLPVYSLSGDGTAENPYIIGNNTDWDEFATNINNGTNADKYYKLADNFNDYNKSSAPVTKMCGSSEIKSFKGTFDGNGKTLYVQITQDGTDGIGPFKTANGASFYRLTVAGTINASEKMNAGGLIGIAYGNVTISNCISSVTISSSKAGDGTHGGFIGRLYKDGTSNIKNCLFNGKLLGLATNSCGGFIGYKSGVKTSYSNCLFAPEEITMSPTSSAVFNRNGANFIDNCYYTMLFGEKQGEDCSGKTNEELLNLFGAGWELKNNSLFPVQDPEDFSFSVVFEPYKDLYNYTGNTISLDYTVTHNGDPLIKGIDYQEIIKKTNGELVTNLVEKGSYILIIQGIGNRKGAARLPFQIIYSGTGTESDPYLIETIEDWNKFAEFSNQTGGNVFEGKYIRLENDLDFGGVEENFYNISNANCQQESEVVSYFAGNFDGNSHTLSGIRRNCNGVFGYITSNAVVKNLIVKDTVLRGRNRTGSIVGLNYGTVINCHTAEDVFVYSTETPQSGDDRYAYCRGGIVGMNKGCVRGCSSATTVMSLNASVNYTGGIVGCNYGTVMHCFYYGSTVKSYNTYQGAIIGYNNSGAGFEVTQNLHVLSIGGINGNDTDAAKYAYKLSVATEGVSLNTASESSINYGLITAVSGTLIFNGSVYAPQNTALSLDFTSNSQDFDKDKLAFDYIYKTGENVITQTCMPDVNGKYSFTMPSADVTFYAGYEWEGAGTQASPYKIENIYQLSFLATRVSILGNTYEGKYFKLENDLEFNSLDNNFTPIGGIYNGEIKAFCGSFDGNGKTIKGLKINTSDALQEINYAGLFGKLGNTATVQDLTIKESFIAGSFACGAVTGYNSGIISNCTVESDVKVFSDNSSASCHGGITGYNTGTISQCNSYASVYNSSAAGGIAGYNKNGTVTDCFYEEKADPAIKADNSYSGFIIGHDQDGSLSGNYCIGKKLYALGLASAGIDVIGAKKLYKITSPLVENLSFVQNQQGGQDFESLIYDSALYAPANSLVKVNLNSFSLGENLFLSLKAVDKDNLYFDITSFADGVCAFTMPAGDVSLVSRIKQTENNQTETDITEITLALKADPYTKDVYYTTFYNSQKSFKVPAGTKIFYVIQKDNKTLGIEEELSGIINAGQAVILQSSVESIKLVETRDKGSYSYKNLLLGTESQMYSPQNIYVLGFNIKGGVGFYKATGPVAVGKAYLVKEAQSE